MHKKVIAVKDTKLGLFDQPVTTHHVGEGIRQFETLVKNPQTKFGQHPADFELYQIANFNEETGELTPLSPYLHLSNGADCVTTT